MNTFFRRGINEYRRQISLKDSFALQTEQLKTILQSSVWKSPRSTGGENGDLRHRSLLLLTPLLEIAWADGRVTRHESDAILEVAETYDLVEDQTGYCDLLDKLTARPMPQAVERVWSDFPMFFESLSEAERDEVKFCLKIQAQFVAEQSSDNLLNFLRGERISKKEQEMLHEISENLETAHRAAQTLEAERRKAAQADVLDLSDITIAAETYYGAAGVQETLDDYSKLIPLVPLVKTAWAEGRVTKRERHLIFQAANQFGITPGTPAHRRLSEWLELHPTDEFYDSALEILRRRWQKLDANEKDRRRFEVLDHCTRIAEASGGASRYPSGGAKICDEEIVTVKRIAKKLNVAATV